jgi:sugar transferase (PEP-CTERM/EpsH1 system associated)
MKILFLTSRFPYPPYGGDKLRVFNFIKFLSRKHEIHLISFIESENEKKYLAEMEKYCKRIEIVLLSPGKSYLNCAVFSITNLPFQVAYYRDSSMRGKVDEMIRGENYDAAYVHLMRMAQYVYGCNSVNRVLDLTDSLSLSLFRSLKYRRHVFFLFYFLEWLKVKRYERAAVKVFERSLLISSADTCSETLLAAGEKISIVGNGVDLGYFKPSNGPYDKDKIAFVGNMHSFPNRDGVLYFCDRILPVIRKRRPDMKFYVIGANPPDKIKKLDDGKTVFVTGPVDDTRKYLNDAVALVCPIRTATGMQNKIMEAMSMGLPVISTKISAQWLEDSDRAGIILADNEEEFAKAVLSVVENDNLRHELSLQARRYSEDNFSWDGNIEKLEKSMTRGANGDS